MQLFTGLRFVLQQQLAFIGTGSSGNKHRVIKRIYRVNKIIDSDTHLNVTWLFCIWRRGRQQYMYCLTAATGLVMAGPMWLDVNWPDVMAGPMWHASACTSPAAQ
jgi:hypothetical protein